jgi:hypothetical protein
MILIRKAAPVYGGGAKLALILPGTDRRKSAIPCPADRPRRPQNHPPTYSSPALLRPRAPQRRKL